MSITISNKTVAYNGALIAVAGVFAYSLVVLLYSIIRSTASIYNIMPSTERLAILWANSISLVYAVAVFSLLVAGVSTLAGAATGVLLRKQLLWFNPQAQMKKAVLISFITAAALLSLLYFLLYMMLKERISIQYAETFLFWYVFPALIYFIAVLAGGIHLNSHFIKMKSKQNDNYLN